MPDIAIKNLKNIQSLLFDIPRSGVSILSGSNGCGKTTLLTCIERLQNSYAFLRHFRTSSHDQFDVFKKGEIIYTNNGHSVSYRYRNTRWVPIPRRNSNVLQGFGFTKVLFLPSTGERFYIQEQELNTRNILAADNYFRQTMNQIFQTTKFSELRRIKLSGRGLGDNRRNQAFVLPAGREGNLLTYYSEKNFSLGEILILNALYELHHVPDRSLVLIDEMELALHPKIQVRFLNFLESIATAKNLSVLVSTHSTSLIKAAPNLIHLQKNPVTGDIDVVYNCYPALALQNVAVEEEVQPDLVFFTEDLMGKYLLESYIDHFFKTLSNNRRPIIKTLPVGGWVETMKFQIASANYLIPRHTSSYCFLDQDAETDLNAIQQNPQRSVADQEKFNLFNNHRNTIRFFDITPELGITDLLYQQPFLYVNDMQAYFQSAFDISQYIEDEINRNLAQPNNPRKLAKRRFDYLVNRISQNIGKDERQTTIMLIQYFVKIYAVNKNPYFLELFNPIFN